MRIVSQHLMYYRTILWVCLLASALAPTSGHAQAAIQLEPVLTGLSTPIYITNAHDGSNRLFVVEQEGVIKVLQPSATSPSVFLDISSRVLPGGERGLLGLTFHPQFPGVNRFFVNYTRRPDGATVIAEYRVSVADPNVAETTETVLLVIPQPFSNHNGGMIEFGPDGYLYIAMGDGGSGGDPQNRAQNINDLLGKMLRIDVDQTVGAQLYAVPPSNPFFGTIPGRDEIYAMGFRNPWRFSFDRDTGELYLGDVGQSTREEIDIVTRGGNYGWRVYEGSGCSGFDPPLCNPANFIMPIAEYPTHQGNRCAITGGYVYRGALSSLPVGAYVAGDYCSGEILLWHNNTLSTILDTGLNISSFGEDENGEIYVVGRAGTVHWIRHAALPNQLSNASFEAGNAAWNDLGNATAIATDAHSGTFSMRVGVGGGGRYQTFSPIAPNTSYALSGWGKVSTPGEHGFIGVTIGDSSGQQHIFYTAISETTYTHKGVRFTTPANAVQMYVWVWKEAGSNAFFFADDLSMVVVSTTNLVLNPGFESGSASWTELGNTSVVQSQPHSGTSALRVGSAAGGRYQVLPTVAENTSYTLRGWGKMAAPGASGVIGITIENSTGQQFVYSFPITETVYTQKSVSFVTPPNTVEAAVWVWKNAGSGAFFFVDDLSLTTP